jgi:hypothetical protein
MAASAGIFVCEFPAADIANQDHPALRAQRSRARAVNDHIKPVSSPAADVDRTPFKATMGKNLRGDAARSRRRPTDRMYS